MKLLGNSTGTCTTWPYVRVAAYSTFGSLTNTPQKLPLDTSIESRWAIDQGMMKIENLFLVRLVSVSRGSFQPEIWVADPSMSRTLLG